MKVLETNILANHPSYPKIIDCYNHQLKEKGKVNAKKFFEEVISPEIPHYKLQSWYKFIKRLKTVYGIMPVEVVPNPRSAVGEVVAQEQGAALTLLSNDAATKKLIQTVLNVSAQAAEDLLANPVNVSSDTMKRIELGLKAMKAQDSRIHAIGKIREDKREQDKFDRAFSTANFSD